MVSYIHDLSLAFLIHYKLVVVKSYYNVGETPFMSKDIH